MESKYEKYVYANIRIPILVNSDDELEPLADYLTLDFESCDALPEKPEHAVDYSVILEKLRELLTPLSDIQEELDELELGEEEEPMSNGDGGEPEEEPKEKTSDEHEEEPNVDPEEKTSDEHEEEPNVDPEEKTSDEPEEQVDPKEKVEDEPPTKPPPTLVHLDEIKHTKHRKSLKHNYSAKSRSTSKKMKNLTMRSRKEIADTIVTALDRVFGSSPPQEAQEQAQEDGQ
jgi:hypothetical protein